MAVPVVERPAVIERRSVVPSRPAKIPITQGLNRHEAEGSPRFVVSQDLSPGDTWQERIVAFSIAARNSTVSCR
jgi:hypothetical protein